jgi:hypothetical protein
MRSNPDLLLSISSENKLEEILNAYLQRFGGRSRLVRELVEGQMERMRGKEFMEGLRSEERRERNEEKLR